MDANKNIFIKSEKRESAVDLVVNHIKQLLMDQELRPGDRLPNEQELSEYMGVSRGSVREAMKILTAFGLVEVKVGNGTYISDAPGNAMIDSLLFSFYVTNPDMQSLYEFRLMFEISVVQLIIKHKDENSAIRKELNENLEKLEADVMANATNDQLLSDDLHFHHLLGKASCNVMMEQVYDFLMTAMSSSIKAGIKHQHGEYILENHRRIMHVINTNDVSSIESVISASLDDWTGLQDIRADVNE